MQISTSESASNETISHKPVYVDDSNITALHRLLWNEQDNIGNFLAKNRYKRFCNGNLNLKVV